MNIEKIKTILFSKISDNKKYDLLKNELFSNKRRWICKFNDDTCDWCKDLDGSISNDNGWWEKDGYTIRPGEDNHKGCNCTSEEV